MATQGDEPGGPDLARGSAGGLAAARRMMSGHVGKEPVLLVHLGEEVLAIGPARAVVRPPAARHPFEERLALSAPPLRWHDHVCSACRKVGVSPAPTQSGDAHVRAPATARPWLVERAPNTGLAIAVCRAADMISVAIPVFPISAPEAPTRDADGVTTENTRPRPRARRLSSIAAASFSSRPLSNHWLFLQHSFGGPGSHHDGQQAGDNLRHDCRFQLAIPCDYSRGEYRQYVRGTFTANGAPVTHQSDWGHHGSDDLPTRRKRDHGELFRSARLSNDLLAFRARSGWRVPIPGTGYSGILAGSGTVLTVNLDFQGKLIDTGDGNRQLSIRFVECSRQRHGALARVTREEAMSCGRPRGCHGFHRRERSARHGHRRDGTGAGLLRSDGWRVIVADRVAEWIRADNGRRDRRSACRPAGT